MEDRKRTILAVVVALIVVAALLYSFGLNLFLVLADPDAVSSQGPGDTVPDDAAGITVEVTPATVQSVVASLTRYESYSRTVAVRYAWGKGEMSEIVTQVWVDDGCLP